MNLVKGILIFFIAGALFTYTEHPIVAFFCFAIAAIIVVGACVGIRKFGSYKAWQEAEQERTARLLAEKEAKKEAEKLKSVEAVPQSKEEEPPQVISPPVKTENHHVTGLDHYQDSLDELKYPGYFYNDSKSELIECGCTETKIYEYDFIVEPVELVEEPDNPHDPNAVKVVVNNLCIGYIKKDSCAHIKNLLREKMIRNISIEIYGGKYKYISFEDYDIERDKTKYSLKKGENSYCAILQLELVADS